MRISSFLYYMARWSRNLKAIDRTVATGSPKPILKRIVNRWIGRHIVSKLWWK